MYSVHFLLEKWRFCLTTQISWVWKPCEMKPVVWGCGPSCGPVCGAGLKDTVEDDWLRPLTSSDGGSDGLHVAVCREKGMGFAVRWIGLGASVSLSVSGVPYNAMVMLETASLFEAESLT